MMILFFVFLLFLMTEYSKAEPRGYLTKFHSGGGGNSALRSNPYPLNTLSYTIFDRNVTFVYLLLTTCSFSLAMGLQWYPFHIPYLELCIYAYLAWLSCINSSQNQNVFRLFHSHKMFYLSLFGPLQIDMAD